MTITSCESINTRWPFLFTQTLRSVLISQGVTATDTNHRPTTRQSYGDDGESANGASKLMDYSGHRWMIDDIDKLKLTVENGFRTAC